MNQQMRDILAKASVTAEGPTQNFQSEPTSHSKSSGNEPRSQGKSLHDRIAERFAKANTELDRRRAIAWAQHELTRTLRRPRATTTPQQEQYWKLQAVQGSGGMDYRRAAERSGLTEKQVWAVRKNAGLDPRTGTPKAA